MDKKHVWIIALVAAVAFGFFAASAYWGKFAPWSEKAAIGETAISPILTNAQATNTLRVGIDGGNTIGLVEGYTPAGVLPKKPGVPSGLEADLARAVAAAIGVTNIEWIKVDGNSYTDRWTFLNNRTVDVVLCQSTVMSARDTILDGTGFEWSPIYYYDGTRVLIDQDKPAVDGKYNIYAQIETSNYFDLLKYQQSGKMPSTWAILTGEAEVGDVFVAETYNGNVVHGACADGIRLNSIIIENNSPSNWVYWPATLSKSPFAAVTIEDDENWAEVVRWTFNVLFEAEEQEYMKGSTAPVGWADPEVPGLSPGWSQAVINAVGNYGEMWDRAFGAGSDRGLNNLWNAVPVPALLYSPPF